MEFKKTDWLKYTMGRNEIYPSYSQSQNSCSVKIIALNRTIHFTANERLLG